MGVAAILAFSLVKTAIFNTLPGDCPYDLYKIALYKGW
jgi:hypothetical protein